MCQMRITTDLTASVRTVYATLNKGERIQLKAIGWSFQPRPGTNTADLHLSIRSSTPLQVIPLRSDHLPRRSYHRGVPVALAIDPLDPSAVIDPSEAGKKFQRFWLTFTDGHWILAGCQQCLRAINPAEAQGPAA